MDYHVHLIAPAAIEDSDFGKFQTTLKEVLTFIKYSSNKDKLQEVLAANKGFHQLGRDEVEVLNLCVGAKLTMNEGEEAINLCIAIEEMKKEAAEAATKEAADKAQATALNNIKKLMKNTGWSVEQAMDMLELPEEERKQLSKLLQ